MKAISFVILLHTIYNYQGERTISGIVHLLKGKRSIQMIQDGHLFQSLRYFGVFHNKSTHLMMEQLQVLTDEGFINQREQYYDVTEKGKRQLKEWLQQHFYLRWLDGWKYKDMTKPFWYRLLLTVQTVSYTAVDETSFRPIIQDYETFQWLKQHFPKSVDDRKQWASQLYSELYTILEQLPEQMANIFVAKFSGANKFGLTNEQISERLEIDKQNVEFILLIVIHFILHKIKGEEREFPIVSFLARDLYSDIHLTQSAQKTYELWQNGYSIEEIAKIRRLKINTIEDHFIEIVIADPKFSIDSFVDHALQAKIREVVKDVGLTKLRLIKERLPEDVSYFQIRLVLINIGEKNVELTI